MGLDFEKFAGTGLQKAKKMGAEQAELFVVKNRSLEVELKDGRIDEIKQSDSHGVGLRVIKGHRQGFSFSTDFRASALDKMVVQAMENSRYHDEDEDLHFPVGGQVYPRLNLYDPALKQHSLEDKMQLAQETAEAAKKWHQQVSRIERSGYEEGEVAMWLANSNGILQHQAGTQPK